MSRRREEPIFRDLLKMPLRDHKTSVGDLRMRGAKADKGFKRLNALDMLFLHELAVADSKLGERGEAAEGMLAPDRAKERIRTHTILAEEAEQRLLIGLARVLSADLRLERGGDIASRAGRERTAYERGHTDESERLEASGLHRRTSY